MAPKKAPAFQFYVRDWRSSRKVQLMSFALRGMYLEMLIEQWDKGAAPSTAAACALALGGSAREWTAGWSALASCFRPRKRDGLLINAKLEAIRRQKRQYLKGQSVNGLEGAKARWQRHGAAKGSSSATMAKDGSASAIASATATADQEHPLPPHGGRVKREERKTAEKILSNRFGHCSHDPDHLGDREACLLAIVLEIRAKKGAA